MPYAIIMAGGRGERFWPRSRMAEPKQFLNLIGSKTMLQLTVERVEALVGIANTYIVAGAEFKERPAGLQESLSIVQDRDLLKKILRRAIKTKSLDDFEASIKDLMP